MTGNKLLKSFSRVLPHSISVHNPDIWDQLIKLLVVPVVLAYGFLSIFLVRQGFEKDSAAGPFWRNWAWAVMIPVETGVTMGPFFLGYPHLMNRTQRYLTWLLPVLYNMVQSNVRHLIFEPVNYGDFMDPAITSTWYKVLYMANVFIYWWIVAFAVPAVFRYFTPKSRSSTPLVVAKRSATVGVVSEAEKGSMYRDVGQDTSATELVTRNPVDLIEDPSQPVVEIDEPISPGFKSKRRKPMVLWIAIISITVGSALSTLQALGIDYLFVMPFCLPLWGFAILSDQKLGYKYEVWHVSMVVFVSGGIPNAAGAFLLSMLETFSVSIYRDILQLLVILIWTLICYVVRNLLLQGLKLGITDSKSMPFVFPIIWIEHLYQKLIFMTKMSPAVVIVAVVFATMKGIVRDTGIYLDIWRFIMRRKVKISRVRRFAELRELQVWLEMNSVNYITAGLCLWWVIIERFFGLPGTHSITAGVDDEYIYNIIYTFSAMFVLGISTHFTGNFYLIHTLKRLRQQFLNDENVSTRPKASELALQSVKHYWRKYGIYNILVGCWAVSITAIFATDVRHRIAI